MSARAKARASLEALKAARAGGVKRTWEEKEEAPIFDVVDEEDYRVIVKGRLAEDDFVEDDGVEGYGDNGEDHWDHSDDEDEEDEEERALRKKERKAAKEAKAKEKEKKLSAAAAKRKAAQPVIAPGANPYLKPKAEAPTAEQEADFMASLMGGLDGTENAPTMAKLAPRAGTTNTRTAKPRPSSLASFKRRTTLGGDESDGSLRSGVLTASSSESDFGGGRETGPSSDGLDGVSSHKKARFSNANEEQHRYDSDDDLGGGGMEHNMDVDTADFSQADFDAALAGTTSAAKVDEDDDDDDLFVKPSVPTTTGAKPKPRVRQLVNAKAAKPIVPKPEPVDDEPIPPPSKPTGPFAGEAKPKVKGVDWQTATEGLATIAAPTSTTLDVKMDEDEEDVLPTPQSLIIKKNAPVTPFANVLEDDSSLKFWWFDKTEPRPGLLMLIGKVRVRGGKDDGKWVSATINVSGIKRKLYVLPRAQAVDSDGNVLDEDDEDEPEFDDVQADFENDLEQRWDFKEKNYTTTPQWVRKKYAFGVKGVPREESNWLEVTCDFPLSKSNGKNEREIPHTASGERYSHVFGTNANAFELLVVEKKIMGPGWLNLKNVQKGDAAHPNTWTKFEGTVDADDLSVFAPEDSTAPKANPPLTILSLSTRSVVHLTENKREVVCASARVYTDCDIDSPEPISRQPSLITTLVRNLFTPFPNGFEAAARASHPKGTRDCIITFKEEKALLTQLVNIFHRHDPDMIVGINFSESELDVLLTRFKDLGIENWSRISRMLRPRVPKLNPGRNGQLLAGRLIVDLNDKGAEAIIEATNKTLTEMCLKHLKIEREDIDPDETPAYFDHSHSTAAKLLHFVKHCEADCYLQMAVVFAVQLLPLTRQITNLAGHSWDRAIAGQRAEANEYLLLHRFSESDYICPDKFSSKDLKALKVSEARAKKAKAKANGEEEVKVEVKKAKYLGGLVFEPTKGLWDRYILVMDYNSLYPSIIQEYDIDFSTIDWTADEAQEMETMPERSPCEGDPQGLLPQLIASLVARRRIVKGLMKDKSASATKLLQYDITQKALKLTANSMYGCLGFESSRFYAKPLAALTTAKGREILQQTKADAESLNLDVIYGDTDSVMINTGQTDYAAAIKIGNDFKKLINEKYKKLEIETDNVFQRMLLLNKKKYAALVVGEDGSTTTEVKGLDMKRREYCQLSKDASQHVLDKILSGEPTETVIEEIHEYLTSLGENVRAGRVELDQYIIYKKLGKDPKDYPDAKSLPHVQVALRLKSKGQSAKAGDVIPYIFCLPESGESTKSGKAANAYHPDELRRAGSTLKIDFEVYLTSQILPPIERLCEHIAGTEKARLADCLGLDGSRFKSTTDMPEREIKTLQSQVSDAERFRDVEPLRVRCRTCGTESIFDGLVENSAKLVNREGWICPSIDCLSPLPTASIAVQLDLQIRACIGKFYEGVLQCDESTCGNKTRMMSVYGKRCLVPACRGTVHFEYSDLQLYNQLLWFDGLFDLEKARNKSSGTTSQDTIQALADANQAAFAQLRNVVVKHLEKNGRRWVSMSSLFAFMGV